MRAKAISGKRSSDGAATSAVRLAKRTLVALLYVFLFLTAQQGALTHAAWHAGADQPLQQDGKSAGHGASCDLHHAYAQVMGGVQAATPLVVCAEDAALAGAFIAAPAVPARFLAPLSRGPPRHS